MNRYAAIDVGTNSVLLLIAERTPSGRFEAVLERAEITRLGRGVDASRTLSKEAIDDTVRVLESFARDARHHGAREIVVSATSAARDATNGSLFLEEVHRHTGLSVEVISGAEEARLSFASAFADFGGRWPLVVLDIGGGSTEFIFGDETGSIGFRRSFDVGSVRMTERCFTTDPPAPRELDALAAQLRGIFSALPPAPTAFQLVGVAGTVTTLCAVARHVDPYDAASIHGGELSREEVVTTVRRLANLPLELRRTVPGLQPQRADVIVAGGLILVAAMEALGALTVRVSDRGLRWGLLADRFRAAL